MWKELKNAITASSNSSNTRVDKSGLAIGSSGWLVLIDNYTHQASFQKRMVVKKQTFAIIGPGSHKNVCSLWDNTVCTMFGTMGYIMCGTMICGTIICMWYKTEHAVRVRKHKTASWCAADHLLINGKRCRMQQMHQKEGKKAFLHNSCKAKLGILKSISAL